MRLDDEQIRRRAKAVKLFSVDLDGTALNDARELTPRTVSALRALMERGYLVVPTTGRAFNRSTDLFPELREAPYAISTNGALVTEASTGRQLFCDTIPCDAAAKLVGDLLDDAGSLVYLNTLTTCRTARRNPVSPSDLGGGPLPFGVVPDTCASLCQWLLEGTQDILEVGLHFEREDGFAHYEYLAALRHPQVEGFRVGENNLEFVHTGVSKAAALKALCKELGLGPEQVCAFGDNGNDVDTLAFAGIGVAMGNAITPVKEAAACVTSSNNDEGVAAFLEKYFL